MITLEYHFVPLEIHHIEVCWEIISLNLYIEFAFYLVLHHGVTWLNSSQKVRDSLELEVSF